MTTPPTVSVITATFNLITNNRQERMCRSVESIHAQTGCQLEHIIIDGGSTDGTLDFLKPYEEKGWLKVYSEPDKGVYDAFNKGIKKATGKYVCFINSDDYLENSQGLSRALSYLEQSGADFSYSPVSYEQNGKIIMTDDKTVSMCNVFYYMPGCHQGMVFKKDLFSTIGYHDLSYQICSDYDFILKAVLQKATFVKVPEKYAVFGLEGLTGNNPEIINKESVSIKAKNFDISYDEAEKIHINQYISWSLLYRLINKTSVKYKPPYLIRNILNMPLWKDLQQFRHWIFTLRTRKGRRTLRLFGINFINEETK